MITFFVLNPVTTTIQGFNTLVIAPIALITWLLLHVRRNLNTYWHHQSSGKFLNAKVGAGEMIPTLFGALLWLVTLAALTAKSDLF